MYAQSILQMASWLVISPLSTLHRVSSVLGVLIDVACPFLGSGCLEGNSKLCSNGHSPLGPLVMHLDTAHSLVPASPSLQLG